MDASSGLADLMFARNVTTLAMSSPAVPPPCSTSTNENEASSAASSPLPSPTFNNTGKENDTRVTFSPVPSDDAMELGEVVFNHAVGSDRGNPAFNSLGLDTWMPQPSPEEQAWLPRDVMEALENIGPLPPTVPVSVENVDISLAPIKEQSEYVDLLSVSEIDSFESFLKLTESE